MSTYETRYQVSYQRVIVNINEFEAGMWNKIKEVIRYRSNELLAWTRMRFLSHKSGISVRVKSGRLASSGVVVEPYRRGVKIFGGIRYNAKDPKTGYNYAFAHFRLPRQSANVVIRPKSKQALAIPIEGAPSTYGGSTFARAGMLFVRNSFDPFDFTPVAILKQQVTYPRRINVETMIYPYIMPKIYDDIAYIVNTWRPSK